MREQHLRETRDRLESWVPDITRQYSGHEISSRYELEAVRSLHAFQMEITAQAIELLDAERKSELTVVDIGDSAGTHLRYLQAMHAGRALRSLSVNLDAAAVEKIRAQGLEAIHSRAEELAEHEIDADVFLSFETLEHLSDPIRALRDLSERTNCRAFVVTVPYVRRSRVGLYHIRKGFEGTVSPETTHVFELSPCDWRLLFAHTGWRAVAERTYLQYPRHGVLRVTAPLWRRTEVFGAHEGFWGVILWRDHTWFNRYEGW